MARRNPCTNCGRNVKRTKGRYRDTAMKGKRSLRIHSMLRSNTQLCADCAIDFIGSRPNRDHSRHADVVCDFCNGDVTQSLLRKLVQPTITRWIGKQSGWYGTHQDVCTDCRKALKQYVNGEATDADADAGADTSENKSWCTC